MSPLVLGLVLAAAFAHAGWNFLAKGADGAAAFVWLCAVAGTVLYVPALAIALGTDPGEIGWTALGLMWDKHAVGPTGLSPIVYYWASNLTVALILAPWVLRARGDLRTAWTSSRRNAVGVGLLSPLAYVLILYALARAPVTYVAPARETSILIGTLLGTTVLAEGDTLRRLLAAGAIVVGVTALALG